MARETGTYAARFCALRLLWAGVMDGSFSSLLLRVRLAVPSSISPPRPESRLPAGMGDVCAMVLSGEPPCCGVGRPWKVKAS
jgi:hypothetical protein